MSSKSAHVIMSAFERNQRALLDLIEEDFIDLVRLEDLTRRREQIFLELPRAGLDTEDIRAVQKWQREMEEAFEAQKQRTQEREGAVAKGLRAMRAYENKAP